MRAGAARRGLTLIEVMISLALGGIVVAGAFQMHSAFNSQTRRQTQVVEMQQSLRVASDVMSRVIRTAGAGLSSGKITVDSCTGTEDYYAVQFFNKNAFPNVGFDSTPGDTEAYVNPGSTPDPDWIRIVALDPKSAVAGVNGAGANTCVLDATPFAIGDVFVVDSRNPAYRVSCLYEVTHINHACNNKQGFTWGIQHNAGQSCVNPVPAKDKCQDSQMYNPPAAVYKVSTALSMFRVDNGTLKASLTGLGQPPLWQVLAENIEDLQVAVILNDGTMCGGMGNSVDNPALCDFTKAKVMRFTLVARSTQDVPGFNLGKGGDLEDEVAPAATDGLLRRSLTTEVELRNMP